MTDSARHDRISELFAAALDVPPERRQAFLDEVCGGDERLRGEVMDLLERDERPAAVDQPIIDQSISETLLQDAATGEYTPKEIGPYDVLGVLGRGGMGTVYKARQRQPSRTIALKVVHAPLMSPTLARRIEYEAQVLARLQNEGIARIYEAGTAKVNGVAVPFFAMEWVDGLPLTEHVGRNRLPVAERIRLIIRVCSAVQHAHQQGVIHRDLKPGNVLVVPGGQPKVLDFGIARVTDSDLKTTTLQTDVGQLIGTVAYMSPEQVAGESDAIDTRSDVYALGVLAFEVLTGRLPYDLQNKPIAEAGRIIRDQDPGRLGEFDDAFQGDLDTILQKALEKDKERRYGSAAGFAADLERYLNHQPIVARPATLTYQIRKFAQRNRALVGAVVATFAVLVVGILGTGYGLVRATQERDDAIRAREALREAQEATAEETAKVTAVNTFLGRMLSSANPLGDMGYAGRDVTVLEMLDREVDSIDEAFADQPAIESAIRTTLGMTYVSLGRYEEAEEQLRRALELHRETGGEDSDDAIRGGRDLAGVLARLGRLDEAVAMFRSALEREEAKHGAESLEYAISASRLGWALGEQGQYKEAERWIRRSLPALAEASGTQPDVHARTINNLARVVHRLNRPKEAEKLYRQAHAALVALHGPRHASVGLTENNIARMLHVQGDLAGAAKGYEQAIRVLRESLGPSHPTLATIINNLGAVYYDLGEYRKSVETTREALAILRQTHGEDHAEYISTLNNMAYALTEVGDFAEAAGAYRAVADFNRNARGPRHFRTLIPELNWASSIAELGRAEEAEATMRRVVETLDEDRGRADRFTQRAVRTLVRFLVLREDNAAASRFRAMLSPDRKDSAALLAETAFLAAE